MSYPRYTVHLFRVALAALGIAWFSGASLAVDITGSIDLGETLVGQLSDAADTVSVDFFAVQGTVLSVGVKASGFQPAITIRDPAGADLDPAAPAVKKRTLPDTGNYTLVIGSASGTGTFQAKTKAKFPSKFTLTGTFPADDTLTIEVVAGANIKGQVKADGSSYQPTVASVSNAFLAVAAFSEKGTTAKFQNVFAETGGAVAIVLDARAGTSGAYSARISAKAPKSKGVVDLSAPNLTGTVTNQLTTDPIAGVTVTLDPPVPNVTVVTDASGAYAAAVPSGSYTLTFAEPRFDAATQPAVVVSGQTTTADATLMPTANVIVTCSTAGTAVPDGAVTAMAMVDILDGSTIQSYSWTQVGGATATITDETTDTATVTLASESAFRDQLILILEEPPVGPDELPPNVPFPVGEFPGGLPDRFHVVGVNPFDLEEAGLVTVNVDVTTTSGTFSAEAEVHAAVPWKVTHGLGNVPIGRPVLLHGRAHVDVDMDGLNDDTGLPTTYDWALSAPGGSAAMLVDAAGQSPYFTPDMAGQYTVTVTDTTQLPGNNVVTITISADTWVGAIDGQDASGRPTATGCTMCHNGGLAPDKFTPWAQSGHAEIFTNNLNTNTHYGENCFPCHLVGYDTDVANSGADDASDWPDFLAADLLTNAAGDDWSPMLLNQPDSAKLANVQCENCHGPNNGPAHTQGGGRISLSADVCAACHGEPLRHARFQQWQLSGHANYDLAIARSQSGNCSRCHTVNGFLTWVPILLDNDPATDPLADITVSWTADESHPQTCATCHDPHNPGSTTGINTNAKVRISGDTPPLIAGFTATDVGRGAMCMTCHNTRRGLRNDSNFPPADVNEIPRAPHGGAQADVLMGENAYFVTTGVRGLHSRIEDACVGCHMEATPPPEVLSYNQGGTNHTFYASPDICSECHSVMTAADVQPGVEADLATLQGLIEDGLLALMTAQTTAGNKIDLNANDPAAPVITDTSTIQEIVLSETSGRQAMTITFTDMTVAGPFRIDRVEVLDAADARLGDLYEFASSILPRSGWNYFLVANDSSKGVHNPAFVRKVLAASIASMNALLNP